MQYVWFIYIYINKSEDYEYIKMNIKITILCVFFTANARLNGRYNMLLKQWGPISDLWSFFCYFKAQFRFINCTFWLELFQKFFEQNLKILTGFGKLQVVPPLKYHDQKPSRPSYKPPPDVRVNKSRKWSPSDQILTAELKQKFCTPDSCSSCITSYGYDADLYALRIRQCPTDQTVIYRICC